MFHRQAGNTNNLPFPPRQACLFLRALLKYGNYWLSFKTLYVKLGSQTIEKIKSSHQIEGDPGKACDVIILVSRLDETSPWRAESVGRFTRKDTFMATQHIVNRAQLWQASSSVHQGKWLSKMGGGSKDCSVSGTLQSTLLLHIHPGETKSFVHRETQVQIFPTVLLMIASN